MKPEAPVVQKNTSGMPSSSAAVRVKLMIPSETMQVTGGTWNAEELLSLERSSRKGARQLLWVEEQRDGTSWVASTSDGGRPSGMVSNWKVGRPQRELGPLDFKRR